jgi:F-type H+-transporting ATPase subunit epsilon
MENKIKLVIVTPEKPVLEKEVDFVALPAFEGEVGILPGHTPMVVELKYGLLRYKSENETDNFAVMGGFAQVFGHEVSVFAESAELVDEINVEQARQEMQKAKHALLSKGKDIDIEAAQALIQKERVRIQLAQNKKLRYKNKSGN